MALQRSLACLVPLGRCTEAVGIGGAAIAAAVDVGDRAGEAAACGDMARALSASNEEPNLREALALLERATAIHEEHGNALDQSRMIRERASLQERRFLIADTPDSALLDEADRLIQVAQEKLHSARMAAAGESALLEEAKLEAALARLRYHQGRWEAAATRFERANSMAEHAHFALPTDLALWGHALFHLASAAGDYSPGQRLRQLNAALEKLDLAVKDSERLGDFDELVQIHVTRGDILWNLHEHAELWDLPADGRRCLETRADAARDYEIGIQLIERRSFLLSRPGDRITAMRGYHRLYGRVVEAHLKMALDRGPAGTAFLERAFHYSERAKAASLSELLTISIDLLAKLPKEIRVEVEAAEKVQREAYLFSESLSSLELSDGERANLRERTWVAEQRLHAAQAKAFQAVPSLAGLLSSRHPSLAEVAAALPEDGRTGVLQLSWTESSLCAFLIARQVSFACIPLTAFRERGIEGILDNLLDAHGDFADGLVNRSATITWRRSEHLWRRTIAEIPARMKQILECESPEKKSLLQMIEEAGVNNLTIIPDGRLCGIPLHAGIGDSICVTYAPSCSILLRSARNQMVVPRSALVVDNPDGTLPGASIEGMLVESKLRAAGLATVRLSGTLATQESILREMSRSECLHYTGHAISQSVSPWKSSLELCWVERVKTRLTAADILIRGQAPPGAVAVVNGCTTAQSGGQGVGEFVGLPAAFLAAGYSLVVSNLYETLDSSSPIVMDRFYDFLASHAHPARALHTAISSVREMSGEHAESGGSGHRRMPMSHPTHWLPYVIWGAGWILDSNAARRDPAPVRFEVPLPSIAAAFPELLDQFRLAEERFRARDYAGQLRILEDVLRRWGGSFFVHSALAGAWMALKQPGNAHRHEIEALRRDPNSAIQHFNLGRVCLDLLRLAEARDSFTEALRLNPGYAKAWLHLGPILFT